MVSDQEKIIIEAAAHQLFADYDDAAHGDRTKLAAISSALDELQDRCPSAFEKARTRFYNL